MTDLYLRDTTSDINPGAENEKLLSLTAPSGAEGAGYAYTVSGSTSAINFKDSNGGSIVLVWFSNPLTGVTISGTMTFNIIGYESNMSANAGMGVKVERTNGSGTVQSTIVDSPKGTELTLTTPTAQNWTATPTSTALSTGDRLKVTCYIKNAGGTMGDNFLCGMYPAVSGATISWVRFTETITEGSATPASRPVFQRVWRVWPRRRTF
jgi:hypothetical protein